jgi:hypothetical protein
LIEEIFAKRFKNWNITLPKEKLKNCEDGFIHEAGWLIQYCFGKNENGKYLDYYAAHRMTDDTHRRIYEDGNVESLPALASMHLTSEDPDEAKRLEDDYFERNRIIANNLAKKGFDKFTINMILHAGLDKDRKD